MFKVSNTIGQAATELAIFGGIIIFIIGSMVRSAISTSYQQNSQLKAMRMALLKSYQTSIAQGSNGGVGRNTASILFIEDRISPDAGKYGSMDRSPFIAQGAGSLTNLLMFPVDLGDAEQNKNIPSMDVYINGKYFSFTTARLVTKPLNPPDGYGQFYDGGSLPDPAGNGTHHYKGWNFACVSADGGYYGCPMFYQVQSIPGSGDTGILSQDESFNLNRSGNFNDDPPLTTEPGKIPRQAMAWQWKAINGLKGQFTIDSQNGNYPSYDVDNDMQEETIYGAGYDSHGIVTQVTAMDYQDGDLNLTYDCPPTGTACPPKPGLQSDTAIYTQTRPGTYLLIKEGKVYNPDGQFVRSVTSKDQMNIIERRFQLSNDTGRFCSGGSPTPGSGVDMCNNCMSDLGQTCFDEGTKMLYIRSRILDKRGRFWKTDVSKGL